MCACVCVRACTTIGYLSENDRARRITATTITNRNSQRRERRSRRRILTTLRISRRHESTAGGWAGGYPAPTAVKVTTATGGERDLGRSRRARQRRRIFSAVLLSRSTHPSNRVVTENKTVFFFFCGQHRLRRKNTIRRHRSVPRYTTIAVAARSADSSRANCLGARAAAAAR